MLQNKFKILIVGDVFGKVGREVLMQTLTSLRKKEDISFLIVNGENTTNGRGINKNHYNFYNDLNIDVITLGNHSFDELEIYSFINESNNIIRPYNLIGKYPGVGYKIYSKFGLSISVFQFIGNTYMKERNENPFLIAEEVIKRVESDIKIVDFHAEATSEKVAFGYLLDGLVDLVYGTHTHIQTVDLRVLNKGTYYISDIGMTGDLDSVIGIEKDSSIAKFKDGKMKTIIKENYNLTQFSALLLDIDLDTKKISNVERIYLVNGKD